VKYNTGILTFEQLGVLIMVGSLHLAVCVAVKTQLQWTGCTWHNDIAILLPLSRHKTHLTRQTTVCRNETQTLSVRTTLAVPKGRKPVSVSRIRFLPAHIWAQGDPHNVSQYVGRIKYRWTWRHHEFKRRHFATLQQAHLHNCGVAKFGSVLPRGCRYAIWIPHK
jgi:hypothetical protein